MMLIRDRSRRKPERNRFEPVSVSRFGKKTYLYDTEIAKLYYGGSLGVQTLP